MDVKPIIAHHIVFCTYGFWLPNDPRGSWSEHVFSVALQPFGDATKVNTKHSRAHDSHDHRKRIDAKKRLMFSPMRFNGQQALAVAHAFEDVVAGIQLPVYACSIMPDHVHLVFQRHERDTAMIVRHLRGKATMMLNERNLHPFENQHTPWAKGFWDVFLHDENEIRRAIHYVNQNPVKDGFKPQHWRFITPYQ